MEDVTQAAMKALAAVAQVMNAQLKGDTLKTRKAFHVLGCTIVHLSFQGMTDNQRAKSMTILFDRLMTTFSDTSPEKKSYAEFELLIKNLTKQSTH